MALVVLCMFTGGMVDPLSKIKARVNKNNKRIDAKIQDRQIQRDLEVAAIEEKYRETIDRFDQAQERKMHTMMNNPKRLAKWLTELSRQ
jgi:hypothetical protein